MLERIWPFWKRSWRNLFNLGWIPYRRSTFFMRTNPGRTASSRFSNYINILLCFISG